MKKICLLLLILLTLPITTACSRQTTTPAVSQAVTRPQQRYYAVIRQKYWLIKNNDEKIFGYLYRPKNIQRPRKIAILAHGLNGSYREMAPYAKNLVHHGYLAYAFDFPGGGTASLSTGRKTTQMSIFSEERDLLAIIKAAKQKFRPEQNKVLLVGASQGGAVSALTASRQPKEVAALVLLYPAFSITDDAKTLFGNYANVPKTIDLMGFKLGRVYFKHLFHLDLTKAATKFRGPVLIMHGREDQVVPIYYSRLAARNFRKASLKVLPHAGHGFTGKNRKKAMADMDRFIAKLNY